MKLSEIDSGVEALATWLTTHWSGLVPGILVVAGLLFVWARTGSAHVINARLYQFIAGKRDVKTKAIAQFLEERSDLMQFRNATGLGRRVGTVSVADRLISWTKSKDVDIDLVAEAGGLFDIDKLALRSKRPGALAQAMMSVAAAALVWAAIALFVWGISLPPLIRVIKTGTWYAVTPDATFQFYAPNEKRLRFTLEQCGRPTEVIKATGYPTYDVEVICKAFAQEAGKTELRGAKYGQWLLLAIALMPIGAVTWLLVIGARQAASAAKLHQQLERSKSSS